MSELPATCPRCDTALAYGTLNAGKGPFRWETGPASKTVFGGNLLLNKPRIWGWQHTPARRCTACHLVLFEADPHARVVNFTHAQVRLASDQCVWRPRQRVACRGRCVASTRPGLFSLAARGVV